MSPYALSILFTLCCLALNGCGITRSNDFNDRLTQLSNPPQPEALAALARDADAAAQWDAEPLDRVALYRVAAVASWQAGEAGERLVLPVTDDGIAACEALPGKDQAAPRDCSLIRLAAPLAVQDDSARELAKLQAQLQQLEDGHRRQCSGMAGDGQERCRAARPKLPAADLSLVQDLFASFEGQFEKVSAIRSGLANLDVDDAFRRKTDRQRVIIYCNAVKAWSLSGDVDGGASSFMAMAGRKKAMADRLEGEAVTNDCRDLTTTQAERWDA
jgi:hypothetical protein